MEQNFNYDEFAIEMSTQAKGVVPEDIRREADYISNTVYLAVTYAGEKVYNNNDYSTKEKEFICQLVCEWAFHKTIDLLRAKIKKEHHKEIMLNILKTALDTAVICIENNIKEKIILDEVEKKITESYIKSLEILYNENLIEEKQLKIAYNQSNIDKMANEYKEKQRNENNTDTNVTTNPQKSLLKYYTPYYIGSTIILALAIYGTVYAYLKINNIEQALNPTVISIITDPCFFIPAIIAIILHDIIQYIFIGFGSYENEYFTEIEETIPNAKGLKNFISHDSIKQRFKTALFLLTMLGVAIYFLIANILKNWIVIVPIIIYYIVAYKNSIPVANFPDIIGNKDFIIGMLAAIITQNFIKNKKNNKAANQSEKENNFYLNKTENNEFSFEELTEFVEEIGEEKAFDYKQFANQIATDVNNTIPEHLPDEKKNKIIKKIVDYALLSGEALENDTETYTTSQKEFIIRTVSEWTMYKSIDITNAGINGDLHNKILQQIAFCSYEIAKQGVIKIIPKNTILKAIELRINEEFTREISELYKNEQISYETYLKAQNEFCKTEIEKK